MIAPELRRCLELAWEAYRAGSFPVGALICDPAGAVVAEGRNRVGEIYAPPGRMRNTDSPTPRWMLSPRCRWATTSITSSTRRSNRACSADRRSAITMAHMGTVRHLAADSLCEGLDGIPRLNGHASRRYPTMHGPYPSIESHTAAVLPMAVLIAFSPTGDTATHYRQWAPHHAAAADRIVAEQAWPSKDWPLEQVITHITSLLPT